VVALADEYNLPLLLHGDAEVVEQVIAWYPGMTIIWAHLGTHPEPALIDAMLTKYPQRLYIDTSVRDERFEDSGKLLPEWRALFIGHADRLLVGIDTYSLQRWQRIDEVTARIRHWLAQLPDAVARKLAYENAARLFAQD
jgi:predicted TIM-barrel fold metal-dependent hydrolase